MNNLFDSSEEVPTCHVGFDFRLFVSWSQYKHNSPNLGYYVIATSCQRWALAHRFVLQSTRPNGLAIRSCA